jgi:hypothetical protein
VREAAHGILRQRIGRNTDALAAASCNRYRMTNIVPKPWIHTLLPAAGIPVAAYATLVITDALRCGSNHASFMAFFLGVFLALPAIGVAIGGATVVLAFWRGTFPLRGWRVACTVLAIGLTIFCLATVFQNPHDPTFCRIDL